MRVLRIQNQRGDGAYGAEADWYSEGGGYPGECGRHPSPVDDDGMSQRWRSLYERQALYRFGFKDLEQMRAWFYRDSWLRALHDVGCTLTEWEVAEEDVICGHTQVVFLRDKATLVSDASLLDLL